MTRTSPVLVGLLVATATLASVRAEQPAARQVAPARANGWTVPRTPDGRPDLQGTWLARTATPLERPKALEGRAKLTDEEVARLKARAREIFSNGGSDFAAGDAVFLAALNGPDQFKAATATHGAIEMIDREFDNHTSLVTDPPDGRIPPLTPAARQRQTALAAAAQRPTGPESLTNAHRCITWTVPRLGGRYGAGDLAYYRILQSRGYVVLYFETGDEARIIPVDGRPHLPHTIAQWNGDSRGRWEGDVLVVETTNFRRDVPSRNMDPERFRLIERFTRTDAGTLRYEYTMADEATWTKPWTVSVPMKQSTEPLYEYACHEGNYSMFNRLNGARADEQAAGKGR